MRTRVNRQGDPWGIGEPEPLGLAAIFARPPLGPARYGRRSTAGGRGHRRSAGGEAEARRRALCWQAFELRVHGGLSIRTIASTLGVSKTLVGRWLRGVPAVALQLRRLELSTWSLKTAYGGPDFPG